MVKYWDECVDSKDMLALWSHEEVRKEWISAGERPGSKVHLSRNPDGQPYLTQTEMRAVAEIVNRNFFKRKFDTSMICAIAEIESARQPLAYRYEPKLKEASTGLMQVLQSTADWLANDMGYTAYTVDWASSMLYRPFVCVYFGAAYLKWLSTYDNKKRNEEFMVRAYNAGPKYAMDKVSLSYWNKYLDAKQKLPVKRELPVPERAMVLSPSTGVVPPSPSPGRQWIYWEERTTAEDMEEMWRQPDVKKEWTKAGEKHGKVRFSRDSEMRPFLTKTELKAVAGIIVSRYFAERGVSPAMLCALAEISTKRLLEAGSGLMQIPYSTALYLYSDLGYKSYKLRSAEDLSRPFVAMYFGAAYVCWLSNYKGRTRSDQFIVQAYKGGPQTVDSPEAGPFWLKYIDALPDYVFKPKNRQGSCSIL